MKKLLLIAAIAVGLTACGDNSDAVIAALAQDLGVAEDKLREEIANCIVQGLLTMESTGAEAAEVQTSATKELLRQICIDQVRDKLGKKG